MCFLLNLFFVLMFYVFFLEKQWAHLSLREQALEHIFKHILNIYFGKYILCKIYFVYLRIDLKMYLTACHGKYLFET